MGIILGLIGLGLVFYSFSAGIGTNELNRAKIFQGTIGALVSLIGMGLGGLLAIYGFF